MEWKDIQILFFFSMISSIFSHYTWSQVWVTWSSWSVLRLLNRKECLCTGIHSDLAIGTTIVYCAIEWNILKRKWCHWVTPTRSQERSSGRLSCSGPCSSSPLNSQASWKRRPFLNICNIPTLMSVLNKQIIRIANEIVSKYNVPQS